MSAPSPGIYQFGNFRLDPGAHSLTRCDGTAVPLTPRVFDTLLFLVQNPGTLLDKERLMKAVWPDSIVEENNLTQHISTLRRIFGETPASRGFIVTVPGRGYRFAAEVTIGASTSEEPEKSYASPNDELNQETTEPARAAAVTSDAAPPDRRPRRIVLSVLVVLALAEAFLFFRGKTKPAPTPPPAATAGPNETILKKSIAVLPFENLSSDAENAHFAIGVQDEILSDLAKIADLKVISRTSANLYKSGSPRNAREIGQQLGVAHLLEGSVQRVGQRVRVNAQLVDARTDAHLWANSYDRDLADVFAMQSEIARTIADQLQARISPDERAVIEENTTVNVAAFDSYLRGSALINDAGRNRAAKENLLRGIELLEDAISTDPRFFLAYCKLANAHDQVYRFGIDHTPERLAAADAAVRAALRLRPDSGESHLALAIHLYTQGNYEAVRSEIAIARRTLPNDDRCFSVISNIDQKQGRWTEHVANLNRALDVDPRNADLLNLVSWGYEFLRDYKKEAAAVDKLLALEPDNVDAAIHRGQVDISWRADPRRLHQTIDGLLAHNPALARKLAPIRVYLALCERDAAAATLAASDMGENTWGPTAVQFTGQFTTGLIARMKGDAAGAFAAFTAARPAQAEAVRLQADFGPTLCVLGLIDAALGRKDEALEEGRRAAELLPVPSDSTNGSSIVEFLAVIHAWTGEKDRALELMHETIQRPALGGYGQFKLLPFWDPLRGDPRFENMVASLAPKD